MPVITFNKKDLFNLIGRELKDEEIEEILNSFKSNIEEITEEEIKVELTADRIDMFTIEGFARVLKGLIGIKMNEVKIHDSKITVFKEDVPVRPFIACAIVKNVKMSDLLIKGLMNSQEILHETIGRGRKKVAIGLHDFDKIKGKIFYKGVSRNEKFVPLGEKEEMSLIDVLAKTEKGKKYGKLIIEANKWPAFIDEEGIFSFPPILNSERTKITENTKNIFIDVTGTDKNLVNKVLNILVLSFSERGYKIEGVKIKEKKEEYTPEWIEKPLEIEKSYFAKILGREFKENEIENLLKKMGYKTLFKKDKIIVITPPYRTDIISKIDIVEDLAIAFGYNNFEPELPNIFTVGGIHPIEKISDEIREALVGFGFQEIVRPALTNSEKQFKKMLLEEKETIKIENPVSESYTQLRVWLLPDLMEFLSKNTKEPYPQKIFEIGDVVLLDKNEETLSKNVRKVALAIASSGSFFAEVKRIALEIAKKLNIEISFEDYNHPSFINGRCGKIIHNKKEIGFFGEINPEVLENFKVYIPVAALEMELNPNPRE
ncbi:MAG: phenylalanine--tRNA ligase subunit beta [Candidatus Aenigmatarchaeota archaeon]